MQRRRPREPNPRDVEILRALPRRHRVYLVQANAVRSRRVDRQCQELAVRLDPETIRSYPSTYLDGNGGSFAWYRFGGDDPEETAAVAALPSAKALVDSLVERRPEALREAGLRQPLIGGAPPVLNKVVRYDDFDVLEYWAEDGVRTVLHGYGKVIEPAQHFYRVVIRDEPLSVEVRAGTAPKQQALLSALQADLKVNLGPDVPCLLVGAPITDTLETALQGRFIGVSFRTRGGGAKSIAIEADEVNGMRQVSRYRDEIALGSQETVRKYEFQTRHSIDGYVESATYEVTLSTGSIRVGARSSEVAIEHLRRNVLSLFNNREGDDGERP